MTALLTLAAALAAGAAANLAWTIRNHRWDRNLWALEDRLQDCAARLIVKEADLNKREARS